MTHAIETVFDVRDHPRRRPRTSGRCTRATTTACTRRRCSDSSYVRDARLRRLQRRHAAAPTYVAAKGDFDECQIDKSGRWLRDQGERRRHATARTTASSICRPAPSRSSSTRTAPPATPTSGTATWSPRTTSTRAGRRARLAARPGHDSAGRGRARWSTRLRSWDGGHRARRARQREAGAPIEPADGVQQQREPRRTCRASTRSSATGSTDR